MTITTTFDPPLPSDSPATFNTKAFSLLGDLNTWSSQANALAAGINVDEAALDTAVATAVSQASAAAGHAANAAADAASAGSYATSAQGYRDTAYSHSLSAGTQASAAAASATAAGTSATAAASSAAAASASAATAAAIVLGTTTGHPTVRPSLNLDFANSQTIDPRITFTRASTATYYDGKTYAKAEENLLLQSQTFGNVVWASGVGGTRVEDSTAAPDGTTTADTLSEDSSTGSHVAVQNVASSGQVTLSVFAKAGTGSRFLTISVSRASTHYGSGTFNLSTQASTQTLIAGYSGSVTTSVVSAANGFYRYSITLTTDTLSDVRIGLSATGTFSNFSRGFDTYTGDGTSSIIIWGAQLEQRSSVTAYTPTTTAPITRYVPKLMTAVSGQPRIDFDPLTGVCKGLLVEESRTNLLLRSEEFDNASWSKTRASVSANVVVSPDGTVDADKLVEDTTASTSHYAYAPFSASAQAYTFSVYLKAAERTWAKVVLSTGTSGAFFNLSAGTVGTVTGGYTATITHVGNGWYRCSVSTTATAATWYAEVDIAEADNDVAFTGDGISGIYIWGAQLEAGAFPTSYIPTTTAQVTRAADVAVMTGSNFSSWYRQDEGTVYVDIGSSAGSIPFAYCLDSGATTNEMRVGSSSTGQNPALAVTRDSATQASIGVTLGAYLPYRAASVYKDNDFSHAVNGTLGTADTSGQVPVVNQLRIGDRSNGAQKLNGCIRSLRYYPARLTNAQLQTLTTA